MAEWKPLTMLTLAELVAPPPVKALQDEVKARGRKISRLVDGLAWRDVRIEQLEAVVLQAIEYIKDLIADADEQWHGDNSMADAAIEAVFDGEKDDKILSSLIAALEDDDAD